MTSYVSIIDISDPIERLLPLVLPGIKTISSNLENDFINLLLSYWQTVFDAPAGRDPVALDLSSMGKGEAWVNGQSIGRYWMSYRTPRGQPSQTWFVIMHSSI